MKTLRVSQNRRFLAYDDGSPFLYLGDTAWELFHRFSLSDAFRYLEDRAAKRFTVIQAVALAELGGLTEPNAQGDLPLHADDPNRPNESYFAHVDAVVNRAQDLGLFVGMLPTWGDKWNRKWGAGPEIFDSSNARSYGEFLGRRYADKPIIWILGGDRPVETEVHREIIRAMAAGLKQGDRGRNLISFHPQGGQGSAQLFHEEPWLDFNMFQSGHARNSENYRFIAGDYERLPSKPCMDAEPGYEDHPAGFNIEYGYLDDYDARKAAYWSLFAGAHGHTYGCHPIWQMVAPGRPAISAARRPWYEALGLPGASQMQHVRALIQSRPYFTRIPDQSLLASEPGTGVHHVRASRDTEGSFTLVYLPAPGSVTLNLEKLSGERLIGHWYNPRNGTAIRFGDFARAGTREFAPPSIGPDWVLTLDDPERDYPAPGAGPFADREADR